MARKNRNLLITIYAVLWIAGIYLISRLVVLKERHDYIPTEGLIAGLVLIGFYQRILLTDLIYRLRWVVNGIALGLGCLLIGLLDSILFGFGNHPFLRLALDFAYGFSFGCFIAAFQAFSLRKRKRATPFQATMELYLTSNAAILNFDKSLTPGRALLFPDRMVFRASADSGQEILFSEIRESKIGDIAGFPNKLVLLLNDAETVSFNLSMPYLWKKKIAEATSGVNI